VSSIKEDQQKDPKDAFCGADFDLIKEAAKI